MFDGHDKRSKLNFDERETLHNQVLPTARKWVREYPEGSILHRHGKKTLEYWGEAAE